MLNQKLNIWNYLTDTTNSLDVSIEFEKRFCGTILEIFIKNTENPFKFYGIYKEFHDIKKRYIFMDTQNPHNIYEFGYNDDIIMTIPTLEKGYYIYNKSYPELGIDTTTLELVYITNNALRQWKRGICKSTYTLELVTEYLKDDLFFTKELNHLAFSRKMGNVLITRDKLKTYKNKNQNLEEIFSTKNFYIINNNFVIIKSLNTQDTYDLLYHKFWVGHTKDLKTLTIIDPRFKQEIYDLLNTTNLGLQLKL